MENVSHLLKQLWQRRVVQFGALYLGAAWVLLQVVVLIEGTLNLPDWVDQTTLVLLAVGFPLALILAWAQETQAHETTEVPASPATPKPSQTSTLISPPAKSEAISIAVIPFDAPSKTQDEETLARGLSIEISNALSQVGSLRAVSSLAFSVSEGPLDLKQVADEWQVRYAVTGSLMRQGGQVRVLAQLIHLADGAQVWTANFDDAEDDLIAIQKTIAESIVRQVGGELMHAEYARINTEDVPNVDAWALTAHSAHIVIERRGGAETWNDAIKVIEKAIELAPNYGSAHARLAALCGERMTFFAGPDPEKDHRRAIEAAERALELAGNDPYTLTNAGQAFQQCGETARARRLLEKAVKLLPHDLLARMFYWVNIINGGTDEEVRVVVGLIEEAIEAHPSHPITNLLHGVMAMGYARLGETERAIVALRAQCDAAPGMSFFGVLLSVLLLSQGETEEASRIWRRLGEAGFHTDDAHLNKLEKLSLQSFQDLIEPCRMLNEMTRAT